MNVDMFAVFDDPPGHAFSDVQRELMLDVQPTGKDQLKLFPVFVEQIYRHAFDGEGFFNGPHHLTEHLLEVQKRADGP